jgi:uncharacterized protein
MSNISRRQLLYFLGGTTGAAALGPVVDGGLLGAPKVATAQSAGSLSFTPVRLPHPVDIYTEKQSWYATGIGQGNVLPLANVSGQEGQFPEPTYRVVDDVVVPPEYDRYVIVGWGDRVFPNREDYVGYNCDYTHFVSLDVNANEGYLWVNHEYVSYPFSIVCPETPEDVQNFGQTFSTVVGRSLPTPPLPLTGISSGSTTAASLDTLSPADRTTLLGEFLYNMGGSVVKLSARRNAGRYRPVAGDRNNRRLHGLSGLGVNANRPATDLRSDGTPYNTLLTWGAGGHQQGDLNTLVGTGPAATDVFPLSVDGLGNQIIGTAFNCSGGYTPWGTVLTCEENFQGSSAFFVGVTEPVNPNGTQLIDPSNSSLDAKGYTNKTTGQEFGQVGEKYGWVTELDPVDPSVRRKHTWLGRFRHENIGVRAVASRRLVAYLGDDRRGGHVYKFVSTDRLSNSLSDKSNSRLFENGILYVARFNPDGTGDWLPLIPSTPTNPIPPSVLTSVEFAERGGVVSRNGNTRLPRRNGIAGQTADGGSFTMTTLNEATTLAGYQGKLLSDFYPNQGAILVDAFLASNLVGGTPSSRPEDLEVNPLTGEVFIAFTDSAPGSDGYPDSRIFTVAKYTARINDSQQSGGLYKIRENSADATGATFRWERFAAAGEAGTDDGTGFANVDNLTIDFEGNVWGVTDMSTGLHNGFAVGSAGTPNTVNHAAVGDASPLTATYGPNSLFVIPTRGPDAGKWIPFAYGPVRCEMTGPTIVGNTMIISVQHPGEDCPVNDGTMLSREVEMLALNGTLISPTPGRMVPRGSSWPSNVGGVAQGAPRPCVIGIIRTKNRIQGFI